MNYDQGIRSLLPSVKLNEEIEAEKKSREIILKKLGVTNEARPTKIPYTLDPLIKSADIQAILKPIKDEADDALTMDRKLDKYRAQPRYNSMQKNKAFMDRIKQDAKGKVPSVDFKLAEAGFESSIPDAISKGKKIMVDRSNPTGFTTMEPETPKQFNQFDKSTYPSKQIKRKSTWDVMMEDAKEEARKGNPKELQELRKIERNYHQPFSSILDNRK